MTSYEGTSAAKKIMDVVHEIALLSTSQSPFLNFFF